LSFADSCLLEWFVFIPTNIPIGWNL
jgi:hypothetical protein